MNTPPPALVWRKKPAGEQPQMEAATRRSSFSAKTASSGSAALDKEAVVTHAETTTALVRAAPLDPALADRLADDVLRRLEKRLRIERERRGL